MHPLAQTVRSALFAAADPDKAAAMAAYMHHIQPFLGINAPDVRRIVQDARKRHPLESFAAYREVLETLWAGTYREERYAAYRIAEADARARHPRFQVPEALPLYERFIVEGAWWDLVDGIAAVLVGTVIRLHPESRERVYSWIERDDLWLRRAALLAQLKHKEETDRDVLARLIRRTAHERDFFMRKAIGWALREYAKTDPDWVRDFVAAHTDILAPLSRREALKHLQDKAG